MRAGMPGLTKSEIFTAEIAENAEKKDLRIKEVFTAEIAENAEGRNFRFNALRPRRSRR